MSAGDGVSLLESLLWPVDLRSSGKMGGSSVSKREGALFTTDNMRDFHGVLICDIGRMVDRNAV